MGGSEEALVREAVAGNEEALSTLLLRHAAMVRAGLKISARWRSVLDAEDVMQVTLLEAFLRIRAFEPSGPGAFLAWLRRIADNNLRDAIRELECDKRAPVRRPPVGAGDEAAYVALFEQVTATGTTPSRGAARHEAKQMLEAALGQLPQDYARVVRLYELEGRSSAEVAGLLGRSPGAVRILLVRARDRLGELLGAGTRFFSDRA